MQRNSGPAGQQYTRKKIEDYSYGLNEPIGKGYSSQVFRGRNDSSNEPVAVKVIDLKMLKNEINRTLLQSEIEILKELKGTPNILHLHEVYTTKNNTYIITELCDSDLNKQAKKSISPAEAYHYMDQIIKGYMQIYHRQIIHRDLKPANLLLSQAGLKIADFGFGIRAADALKPSKYNVGSPLYMAPESLKKNEYSYGTDLWSIGVIFYEMLDVDTPWRAKSEKELIKKIDQERIDTILKKKDFGPKVTEFLSRILRHDKQMRMTPDQLSKFAFASEPLGVVLREKTLNHPTRSPTLANYIDINLTSPKNCFGQSLEKRFFDKDKGNHSIKKLGFQRNQSTAPRNSARDTTITGIPSLTKIQSQNPQTKKQTKKHISKLLICEVHFCRFLFKLLNRLKESTQSGILSNMGIFQIEGVFSSYTRIIKHKIDNLKDFDKTNFLGVHHDSYRQYKETSDFKKLVKISKQYQDRYSADLPRYWNQKGLHSFEVETTLALIQVLFDSLKQVVQSDEEDLSYIQSYSKDVIALDYLITAKQLIELYRNSEDYERFTRKSQIEQIVEGSTNQIDQSLFEKILQRAETVLKTGGQRQLQALQKYRK